MTTGINTNTPDRIVLDAGAFYRDYDEAGQELVGATRGGGTFTVEINKREIEADGARGPIKGMRRTVRHTARLEFTLIEISLQTFIDLMHGEVTSDGTHHTITPSNTIADADYYTNVAWVGDVQGQADPIIITLLNALVGNGDWSITVEDQNEGELSVVAEAHYDPTALNTVPYTVQTPVGVS